jgi:hypothetical protein
MVVRPLHGRFIRHGGGISMHRGRIISQWLDRQYIVSVDEPMQGLSDIAAYLFSDVSDSEIAESMIQWHRAVEAGSRPDGYHDRVSGTQY